MLGLNVACLGSVLSSDTTTHSSDTPLWKLVYQLEHPQYQSVSDTSSHAPNPKTPAQEYGLDAAGSITRGIQVSSNATVALQSNMYLRIKGNLNDDYTVQGVLTDKTSPLQPIGNTRRLNDFERVMIEIDGPAFNAAIGDLELRLRNGRFGKLDRSMEGIRFKSKSPVWSVESALGFSYGKYHLQQIQGKNGKQGPYRLSGKNGEKFIIILAGSEQVKLDNQLLTRGKDADYIIDYNSAEIHFTQQHILSANSRISIEFEYVPDIYLASYSFGKQLTSGAFQYGDAINSKFYLSASWHDIRDNASNPLGEVEVNDLKDIFRDLGSDVNSTEVSTVVRDTVLGSYDLDTTGVLVYRGVGAGEYQAEFTFVGLDSGSYRKIREGNTTFFVFDPHSGEYSPARQFNAPRSLQVLSFSGHARQQAFKARFDLGLSQDTKNLYAQSTDSPVKHAWDIALGIDRPFLEVQWGDRHYEAGYLSHDALESIEFYRQWHLSNRIAEAEHLRSGFLRIGKPSGHFIRTTLSQMERSGILIGEQAQIDLNSSANYPLQAHYKGTMTSLDSAVSQLHDFITSYQTGALFTSITAGLEDGSTESLYANNDHLRSGVTTRYSFSGRHQAGISYERRMDYRFRGGESGIFSGTGAQTWSDLRQDWMTTYSFKEVLETNGKLDLKYRIHETDSGATRQYYLGDMQLRGTALNQRLSFFQHFILDEEHIPTYDHYYIEVDTGYGNFSFDPVIQDYIPLQGGRFVRQRLYSDLDEQVRKYDNKTRLEFSTEDYNQGLDWGIKARWGLESRLKQEISSSSTIQSQSVMILSIDMLTGGSRRITGASYRGRTSENISTLYSYGKEENQFNSHEITTDISWSSQHQTTVGLTIEARERHLEYNPLAHEQWRSMRPKGSYLLKVSPQQKVEFEFTYSHVDDLHLNENYKEILARLNHSFRFKRRGRIDQKLSLSSIQAEVSAIPYAVFSGRQPGENWKYSINGRYTFSSMFQLSMNYSLQKRGENRNEQYLRVEGRTHF